MDRSLPLLSRRCLGLLGALLLLGLPLPAGRPAAAHSTAAQRAAAPSPPWPEWATAGAQPSAPPRGSRPLGEFLRPDGTLELRRGSRGSLDARGWQPVGGPGDSPHLAPLAADDHWDARFYSPGMNDYVDALAVDGSGSLYAGGDFTTAGGVLASHIARGDGTSWAALGSGMNGTVHALVADSSGNLYAGGHFTTAGGVPASHVARWGGTSWAALGSGMDGTASALAVDGSGNLYAGGNFTTAGGVPASCIARWDGTSWAALGSGMDNWVDALAVDGSGNLYAGGSFIAAGGVPASRIARWDGTSWSPLGSGMNDDVLALAVDGDGYLYAGGWFTTAGGVAANYIARWDGASWAALGSGVNGAVGALAVDGSGNLYAGGFLTTAGGVPANRIARWDGASWAALGSGMSEGEYCSVAALAADGNGGLYAGGAFLRAGGKLSTYIAQWHNAPPVAAGDGYTTLAGTPLVVVAPGVLGNDTDAESDPLAALLGAPPYTGTLVLNADGSFVYTPALGFSGVLGYSYRATDGVAESNAAAVTINVLPRPAWRAYLPLVSKGGP